MLTYLCTDQSLFPAVVMGPEVPGRKEGWIRAKSSWGSAPADDLNPVKMKTSQNLANLPEHSLVDYKIIYSKDCPF